MNNDELKEWNDGIDDLERLSRKSKEDALKRKRGFIRWMLLWLSNFAQRWADRGRKWRNDDLYDE